MTEVQQQGARRRRLLVAVVVFVLAAQVAVALVLRARKPPPPAAAQSGIVANAADAPTAGGLAPVVDPPLLTTPASATTPARDHVPGEPARGGLSRAPVAHGLAPSGPRPTPAGGPAGVAPAAALVDRSTPVAPPSPAPVDEARPAAVASPAPQHPQATTETPGVAPAAAPVAAAAAASAPSRPPTPRVSAPAGTPEQGAGVFRARCTRCHGVAARMYSRAQWTSFLASGRHDRYLPLGDQVTAGELASVLAYLRENAADAVKDEGAGVR